MASSSFAWSRHDAHSDVGDKVLRLSHKHAMEDIHSLFIPIGFQIGLPQQAIGFQMLRKASENVETMRDSLIEPLPLLYEVLDLAVVCPEGDFGHAPFQSKYAPILIKSQVTLHFRGVSMPGRFPPYKKLECAQASRRPMCAGRKAAAAVSLTGLTVEGEVVSARRDDVRGRGLTPVSVVVGVDSEERRSRFNFLAPMCKPTA
jgi:hypothetical protein